MAAKEKMISTIGHSTHTFEHFLAMLASFNIKCLVDVRRYPGSRKYPHFNQEVLAASLADAGIKYTHEVDLGGRRTASKDSKNTAWRVAAFKGYADYMETDTFRNAAARLEKTAENNATAYMCSEAVWWSCHRSLISDFLKVRGWQVMHIMEVNKSQEHPYTKAASIINGQLDYTGQANRTSQSSLFS